MVRKRKDAAKKQAAATKPPTFVCQKAMKAEGKRAKQRARTHARRQKRRVMEAVEADLASADESVSSSETSVSMATAVRRTALTKAKEAKRLFCIAGALTEIEAVDPTGTKPRKKERGRTGMADSSSTEAGTAAGATRG